MSVRRIHHDDIHTRGNQNFSTSDTIRANSRRRADTQAPLRIFRGVGMRLSLFDVLDRNQTNATILVINDEQFLDPMLMQQSLGFIHADILANRHQFLFCHQLRDRLTQVCCKAHISVCEYPGKFSCIGFNHWNARDPMRLAQSSSFGQSRVRPN